MELLIRVVDKEKSGDLRTDVLRTTKGDVIVAKPDGHEWGRREVVNPEWRIIQITSMQQAEADALVAAELPADFNNQRLVRKRQMFVDVDALNILAGGAILAERTPSRRGLTATVSLANLRACVSLKEPVRDPAVIGPDDGVIG